MSFLSKVSQTLEFTITILPKTIELVKAFEIPEACGKGDAKKDAVIGIVKAAIDNLPDDLKAAVGGDNTIKFVGSLIDIAVKFLNAVGVFKK